MVTRRGFLGFMVGAAVAPAVVKAENLMKIFVPKKEIILPVVNGGTGATALARLGADFDGDVISSFYTHLNEEQAKMFGIAPEMINRLQGFDIRYPITSAVSIQPRPRRVEALVVNDFKAYW